MGLFDGLFGNATEIDISKLEKEFQQIYIREEGIVGAFKVIRDLYAFTNLRLVLVDRQGIRGKKVEYHSIPYKSISPFSVETGWL